MSGGPDIYVHTTEMDALVIKQNVDDQTDLHAIDTGLGCR